MKNFLFILLLVVFLPISGHCALRGKVLPQSLSVDTVLNKSYVTFSIDVSASTFYRLNFWMIGVKHIDGTYSSYAIKINGVTQTGIVEGSKGDWHFASTNQDSFYLETGINEIQIVGTLHDLPNIEYMYFSSTAYSNSADPSTIYGKIKNNTFTLYQMEYETFDYNKEFHYSGNVGTNDYPPCWVTGHASRKCNYTFYRKEYYKAGQTITFRTDTRDNVKHVLHVFSSSSPSLYSWSASSTQGSDGHATMTINVTKGDYYYILIRAYEPNEWGTCNLIVNASRCFEDIPINNYRTDIELYNPNKVYACFAKGHGVDPMIFLIGSDSIGQVINYNDDYPYTPSTSNYDWGVNARINQVLSNDYWVLTTKKYTIYDCFLDPRIDTFTGCEVGLYPYPEFPNLKADDIMYSGSATPSYNCISWVLGEWTIAYWLSGIGHQIEAIDSLFSIYGFTRNGVSASTAVIDLYATGTFPDSYSCEHAAVKAKRQVYAAGYDWESKLGQLERIFHPRYDVRGLNYGDTIAHYARRESFDYPPYEIRTILNVELDGDEFDTITSMASYVSSDRQEEFERLYQACIDECANKVTIFISAFERFDSYLYLLEYSRKAPDVLLPLVFNKVVENEILGVKLLHDLTDIKYKQLWDEVYKELARTRNESVDKRIVHSIQTESKLFIKAFLNDQHVAVALAKGKTMSSDPKLGVVISSNDISISFSLDVESKVSLIVADMYGSNIQYVFNGCEIEEGEHQITIQKPISGTYVVSLLVNGSVYEKKICI